MFKYSEYVYYAMYIVGFIIMLVINKKQHSHFNIEKNKAVSLSFYTYFTGIAGAFIMGSFENAITMKLVNQSADKVAIFGAIIFCPVFWTLAYLITNKLTEISKYDLRDCFDLLTPGVFIILTCAKFGCVCSGCCYGIKWENGIYNPIAEAKVFPVQIFEVISMLIVLLLGFIYTYKSKHFIKGTAYPVTASLYCITRFFWEYFRYYESDRIRHLIFGLSLWQFLSLVIIFVSVISVILLYKKPPLKTKK